MLDLEDAEILRAALENLPMGVCLVDREKRIRFWNDGAERISGYLRQDVMGRRCSDVLLFKFHEIREALCGDECPLAAAMRDGKVREERAYLHHKSGYAVPVSFRAAPLRDARGHVIGAVESFIDKPCTAPERRPDSALSVGQGLDAVTLLPDMGFTQNYLAERLNFAAQHHIPFGVLCVQVIQLDELTATHGPDASEAILNVIAHSLRNGLDAQDFVGRWSEDQFLAILANGRDIDLLAAGERLGRLAQSSAIVWWGDQLSAKVSIGGTVILPGEPVEALLERAGTALVGAEAKDSHPCVVLLPVETPKAEET